MNAVTRQTIVCRQCGTWGDDSMPAKAADLCGYCSDDDNTALVWADADTLVVARLSTGNLVRTITWNLGTDRVTEEQADHNSVRRMERNEELATILDYSLANGWTLEVLTSNRERSVIVVDMRATATTTLRLYGDIHGVTAIKIVSGVGVFPVGSKRGLDLAQNVNELASEQGAYEIAGIRVHP